MSRSKIEVCYKDGSMTKIRCKTALTWHYLNQYINKDSVVRLTSQEYPFKNNPQLVHKSVDNEVTA